MEYIAVRFKFQSDGPQNEILMAYLAELDFESFEENKQGLTAYIQSPLFDEPALKTILETNLSSMDIWYNYETITDQNWNELWESNYQPVKITDQCLVRAPFHEPDPSIKYEIVIEPQMSFGTAHHETTSLMLQYILENDFEGLNVLDMGCGTAVLAILAAMKGAGDIEAIDIDEWAYKNSLDNVKRNNFPGIKIFQGGAELLKGKTFSAIFANINRNILLNDIPHYAEALKNNGAIFFSGFYQEDLKVIKQKAAEHRLEFVSNKSENNWVAAHFKKK